MVDTYDVVSEKKIYIDRDNRFRVAVLNAYPEKRGIVQKIAVPKSLIREEPYKSIPKEQPNLVYLNGASRYLIAEVAHSHGFTYGDIIGSSRTYKIIAARFEAIDKIKNCYPLLSLTQIARIFNKDHTTILSNLRKISFLKENDLWPPKIKEPSELKVSGFKKGAYKNFEKRLDESE